MGQIDTVYDRAALTALQEDIRALYVARLRLIVPETTNVFLLATEDAEEMETPSQAFGVAEEIKTLYSNGYEINLAHVESVFEVDPESPDRPLGTYRVQTLPAFQQIII
ncbi:MAG: hypothetical protein PHY54_01705 [Methylococcales bacterium]|nr:hypothetical protein [Methylococcales bacterium]